MNSTAWTLSLSALAILIGFGVTAWFVDDTVKQWAHDCFIAIMSTVIYEYYWRD